MRAWTIALILLAGLSLSACSKKSSLYLEPGKSTPSKQAEAEPAPAPSNGNAAPAPHRQD